MDLPAPVAASLTRAIAAYLRDAPANEIPARLKRFRSFRPQALAPHRATLIAALDDGSLRDAILEWLKDSPPLKKDDADLLAVAARREDGWERELSGTASPKKRPTRSESERLRDALERERERAARAKEELRNFREKARQEIREAKQRATDAAGEVKALRAQVREAQLELRAAATERERAQRDVAKEMRVLRREAEKASGARSQAEDRVTALKREVAAQARRVNELERALDDERARLARARERTSKTVRSEGPRRKLKAPKGLLDTAPETLSSWLARDGVRLIVDGYNVGKADGGFPDLPLETMRNRVVDEIAKLARKHSAEAIVVFDGAEVAPGTARRSKGPVKVQYSRSGVIADDHIVDLVESLPPTPVIVATNDRELQGRVAALGATVATSDQLLGLIR